MATLLVASAGGHLQELRELLPRLEGPDLTEVTWVTYDTPQSRSLLAGENVVFAPYANPRQPLVTARHALLAHKMLKRGRFSHTVSTGSSIAVAFLPRARLSGSSCHYIESAARLEAPSLTGRILAAVPGIQVYSQVQGWREPPWHYRGSVFDGYRVEAPGPGHDRLRRIVVAVGSMRAYGFRRLVERLVAILPADAEVLWQTGATDVSGLGIAGRAGIPSDELAAAIAESDLVVTHAGVGLSLLALANGRCPVVVPRRSARGEHVDDHQAEVAAMLSSRGLAVACEVDELSPECLDDAASRRVTRIARPPGFQLETGRRSRP